MTELNLILDLALLSRFDEKSTMLDIMITPKGWAVICTHSRIL